MNERPTALIIGAGPAGLTAALEFLRRSDIRPIVLEASQEIGGISRTVRYKGNRMDIGGHRFFSKSDRVMNWWTELMPVSAEENGDGEHAIRYQNKERKVATAEAGSDSDLVMLVRQRKSRIYFLRTFFDYPLSLSGRTLHQLGTWRMLRIGTSYIRARLFPRKQEVTLEDFLINRFGEELYRTFFKSYTEKVWGVPCDHISAEWGAQRIKGLSLRSALAHFFQKAFSRKQASDIAQKETETSLIEKFLYPKYGPGQLWEYVAELVTQKGGCVQLGWRVNRLHVENDRVVAVEAANAAGETRRFAADYVFSTMPIRELIRSLDVSVPEEIQAISDGLVYRDFLTVGLLVNKLSVTEPDGSPLKDTWIYIQEPDVQVGRLQIFNNWSPYLVADPDKMWIGLEYFCYDTDELWHMRDEEIKKFAIAEIEKIGILKSEDVLDAHVVRVPKTYPAYFGTYDRFDEIIRYMDRFENLFLVGRNGMHKYNNQDHSMLTAMTAVDNIIAGNMDKHELWEINTEQEYHEEK
ncbi:NAD(P)/FAD-dependent oxidoreductase [Acidobacterium sp. S8]|uniref:NAD(P)/FAD-dependent oxidoreductase n=1 Tax=Acidobacterium sp. S8 TaxID=1641854 RepID=UPI00131E461C|nr:NAD(P)/FAD-dependent oxidoreductase [Acidobacterium sp. S8]